MRVGEGAAIDLVVVGYRPGALHAASRIGARVLLVDDKPASKAARRRIVEGLVAPLEDDPQAVAAHVLERLDGRVPRAVLSAGERGVLAAARLRERLGLDGVDPDTARLARDKVAMKAAVRAAGVPCTDWCALAPDSRSHDLVDQLGLPLVLKRRSGSGTAGLMVAATRGEARSHLASIPAAERPQWMAERFVRAEEMSVESFLQDGRILFTNPTEYFVVGVSSIAPAALDPDEAAALLELNRRALATLGITRGMTHLEVYRTPDGPCFGEVAVRPPGGRLMRLIRRAYGFDPWEVLVRLELGMPVPMLLTEAARVAGAWMLHPGAGRVVSVRGLADARRVRGVRKLVCRARAGRTIAPRRSTGNDVGWIEVSGPSRDTVAARLTEASGRIRFTMETEA